jgi:glycosyltransferase involved in cell wall biosynthesis
VQSITSNAKATKRLLIVVPIYASYLAFLKGLAAWLIDRGWEVHVATNLTGAEVGSDVATLHDIAIPRGANPLKLFQAGRSLTKLIQQIQPTVVHAHFSVGMLVLALASRVKGVRTLGTFQGMRFPLASGISRWVFKCVECFSILRLDQSWVLTADDYKAVPKFVKKKLEIQEGYGFGCDIEHFDPARFSETDRAKLRSELGIPSEDLVFVFVGRLTAFKGFLLALEAFQQLRKERKDVHFLVVGEPDPQHLLNLPDLNGLEGVYPTGWQDDPAPYLAIADAMVFPSEREGMPVCVMEALASGLSVIGCARRGVRELITHKVTGLIVSRNVDSIKSAMASVVVDPSLGTKLTAGALKLRGQLDCRHFYDTVERSFLL